jgi:hypothetical protein
MTAGLPTDDAGHMDILQKVTKETKKRKRRRQEIEDRKMKREGKKMEAKK